MTAPTIDQLRAQLTDVTAAYDAWIAAGAPVVTGPPTGSTGGALSASVAASATLLAGSPTPTQLHDQLADVVARFNAWISAGAPTSTGAPTGATGAALDAEVHDGAVLLDGEPVPLPEPEKDPQSAALDAREVLLAALHDELQDQDVAQTKLYLAVDRALKETDFTAVAAALAAADQIAIAAASGVSGAQLATLQSDWTDARAAVVGPAREVIAVYIP